MRKPIQQTLTKAETNKNLQKILIKNVAKKVICKPTPCSQPKINLTHSLKVKNLTQIGIESTKMSKSRATTKPVLKAKKAAESLVFHKRSCDSSKVNEQFSTSCSTNVMPTPVSQKKNQISYSLRS